MLATGLSEVEAERFAGAPLDTVRDQSASGAETASAGVVPFPHDAEEIMVAEDIALNETKEGARGRVHGRGTRASGGSGRVHQVREALAGRG